MTTNQDKFLYAVGTRVQGVCEQPPPAFVPPGGDAEQSHDWFIVTGGSQPAAVNNWLIGSVLPGLKCVGVPYTFKPGWGNAFSYMAAMSATISNFASAPADPSWPKATLVAWMWFREQPLLDGTQCEIPMEVIGWIAEHPPIVVEQMIMMKRSGLIEAKNGKGAKKRKKKLVLG